MIRDSRFGRTEKRDDFTENLVYYRSCDEQQSIIWAGHAWRSDTVKLGNITRERPDSKLRSVRPRQRWSNRINANLRTIGIANA